MPDLIPAYVICERFDRAVKQGLADQARDNRADLHRGLADLVSALGWLKDAGDAKGVHAYLSELAKVAHDGIRSRDAELRKDIDNAGEYAEPIDLEDLDQLITAMEGGR